MRLTWGVYLDSVEVDLLNPAPPLLMERMGVKIKPKRLSPAPKPSKIKGFNVDPWGKKSDLTATTLKGS